MAINIEMPKLSDTMTEGTVVKWLKKPGDVVEIGDVLAEIETDKATMEMESFDDGTLGEILIQDGEKALVGATLAILNEKGAGNGAAAAPPVAADKAEGADAPQAAKQAATAVKPAAASAPPAPAAAGDRIKASPLARKVAAANGVDLATVHGSGPGGRIVKADVEAAGKGAGKPAAPAAAKPAAAPAPAAKALLPTVSGEDQVIPLSSMRRIIAERLLTSKTTIPHFYLHVEVDAAPLMALRQQINAQAEQTHGNKYSVNDFILKAAIQAATAVPAVNASFNGDSIVQFGNVGMSVAIAVEDGLVTPVIKQAQTKSLLQISREVKDFAVRAKDKKLKPSEFDGGTITVSNLGAFGIESFDAIVNPPQAAILSVGAVVEKPVVKGGQIVPGMRMNLGLSCDHRVVDGAVGAKYLAELKKLLESPALMLI
jgi:pyruvate dehydrogenase E2 component (dihydrolipoamide acetyltransferase)